MSHSFQFELPITLPNYPRSAYSRIDRLLHGDPYYSYKKKLLKNAKITCKITCEYGNTPETNLVKRWLWNQEVNNK